MRSLRQVGWSLDVERGVTQSEFIEWYRGAIGLDEAQGQRRNRLAEGQGNPIQSCLDD